MLLNQLLLTQPMQMALLGSNHYRDVPKRNSYLLIGLIINLSAHDSIEWSIVSKTSHPALRWVYSIINRRTLTLGQVQTSAFLPCRFPKELGLR
jgi:hypothetical protein